MPPRTLLVIARQFGFPSWAKLKAHLELVQRYARSPHQEPIGGPVTDDDGLVDEFLRLACLNYGDDDPARWQRARGLLEANPWLAAANVYAAAAVGDVGAARALLAADPRRVGAQGGPHTWEPLLYLTYSRLDVTAPGRSAVDVADLLLDHGADPNAGYLWEGLVPPFTALTGALGRGEGASPAHRDALALARLLLEAGADANDGQALYNRGWGPDPQEDWLELLFEFGLGTGDGGPWRWLLGDRQDSPEAVVLLIQLGFDVNARSRTAPLHEAAMRGNLPVIRLLLDHGADPNIRDTGYDATPAAWAEHHGQPEAQRLLKPLEQTDPSTSLSDTADRPVAATQTGAAMRTVAAAFTAASDGRFDELGSILAADIDWHGLADEDGQIPRCHGRDQALERMRIGLLANREVSVSAFVEAGDRVLAHVHRVGDDDELGPPERFLVAEVHNGQITHLRGYATEPEAHDALHPDSPPDAPPDSDPRSTNELT